MELVGVRDSWQPAGQPGKNWTFLFFVVVRFTFPSKLGKCWPFLLCHLSVFGTFI